MRSFRHWNVRYIYDRLMLMAYQRTHPDSPWLDKNMIEILRCWLRPQDRGMEWGSGRSTSWFAKRVASLVSVEHDPVWYARVKADLERHNLQNVEYHCCPDEAAYCAVSENYSPESFDFCLVDGIARDRCVLAALTLVKPGGIVVVDNCNWYLPSSSRSPYSHRPERGPVTPGWGAFAQAIVDWRYIWMSNGVFDTGLWVKPGGGRGSGFERSFGAEAGEAVAR